MHCPFCGAQDTKVIDSRLSGEGDQIRRRRECLECQERFTTYENVELTLPRVVKQNGSREMFSIDKLRSGFLHALQKRAVPTDLVEKAINKILHKLRTSGEREISSQSIGEWVMNELKQLDQVAYVRFASVYRSFKDLEDFRREIEKLSNF
ncbi:MAG: transcriptional regulator NrdR [Gammaproteobacteria bacterium]|nr:transcriptional regulator NrdR [Gammaproteobacteria bacterium]